MARCSLFMARVASTVLCLVIASCVESRESFCDSCGRGDPGCLSECPIRDLGEPCVVRAWWGEVTDEVHLDNVLGVRCGSGLCLTDARGTTINNRSQEICAEEGGTVEECASLLTQEELSEFTYCTAVEGRGACNRPGYAWMEVRDVWDSPIELCLRVME